MKESHYKKYLEQKTWFHGTTLSAWKELCNKKVKVDYNIGTELDFGYGFYLAPKEKQAAGYITRMLPYMEALDEDDRIPVVIEFELDLSKLNEKYRHTKFLHFDEEFARFVFENRTHPQERIHNYDFIIGVMSDSNPQKLIFSYRKGEITDEEVVEGLQKFTSMEQLSLHNQEICDILKVKRVVRIDNGKELDANEYNI